MLEVMIKILAVLDDMNEEIDRFARHRTSMSTGISRRIKGIRKEVNNLQASDTEDDG